MGDSQDSREKRSVAERKERTRLQKKGKKLEGVGTCSFLFNFLPGSTFFF
jgi:hypothetical protein